MPDSLKPTQRRFRVQFSLRLLVLFTSVMGVALGWIGIEYKEAKKISAAIANIESRGGHVAWTPHPLSRWFPPTVDEVSWDFVGLSNISVLAELPGVRRIALDATLVKDLTPLAKLRNLERLTLSNTPVKNIEPLMHLSSLKTLDLGNTSVDDESVEKLKKQLPRCHVYR